MTTYQPAPPPPELAMFLDELATRPSSSTSSSRPRPRPSSAPFSSPASASTSSSSAASRQQRRARARATAKQARAEKRAAFRAELARKGGGHCRPREVPQRIRARVRAIHETRSGSEARRALGQLPRHWRARVELVARTPRTGRELAADLHEPWSRLVLACAWWLYASRRTSKRHGFSHTVDGYTQAMVCALFRNAEGLAYSRSRLFATSYRASTDERGPMVALREAALIHYAQPPLEHANPRFTGPPKPTGRLLPDGTPETRCHPFGIFWLDTGPPS